MILLDTDLLIVANPGSSDNYFMPLSRFKSDLLSGNFAELLFILERDGISYKTRFGLLSNESSFLPTDIIMLERDGISYKLPIFELIWWITPPPSFIGNLTIDGPEVVYIDTEVTFNLSWSGNINPQNVDITYTNLPSWLVDQGNGVLTGVVEGGVAVISFDATVTARENIDVTDSPQSVNMTISVAPDLDAINYILRVESADGQSLEPSVVNAIHKLFIRLKYLNDNFFEDMTTAALFVGPRTLLGALRPLRSIMVSITNSGFPANTYNRSFGINKILQSSTHHINTGVNIATGIIASSLAIVTTRVNTNIVQSLAGAGTSGGERSVNFTLVTGGVRNTVLTNSGNIMPVPNIATGTHFIYGSANNSPTLRTFCHNDVIMNDTTTQSGIAGTFRFILFARSTTSNGPPLSNPADVRIAAYFLNNNRWYPNDVVLRVSQAFTDYVDDIQSALGARDLEDVVVEENITKSSITRRVRARDEFGRFLADDPTTPENEAWIDQT